MLLGWLVWSGCTGAPPEAPPRPVLAPEVRPFLIEFGEVHDSPNLLTADQPSHTRWAVVDRQRTDLRPSEAGAPGSADCDQGGRADVLHAAGHPWLVQQRGCAPGELFLSRLDVSAAGVEGSLHRSVDTAGVGGLWGPLGGTRTPWNTYLAAESVAPDGGPEALGRGWLAELTVLDAEGASRLVKRRAPGRLAHRALALLPDERTLYLADGASGGGLFMFIADRPRDLSSGWLYAARITQREASPFGADIAWISLGHAEDTQVDAWLAAGVGTDDLFQRQAPVDGVCPDGLRRVRAGGLDECLALQAPSARVPDVAKAASRLETRRYAGLFGATTEFANATGLAFDPGLGRVYLAYSAVDGRMLDDGTPMDADHLRLPPNPCGMVLAGATQAGLTDQRGGLIGSRYALTSFSPLFAGTPVAGPDGPTCLPGTVAHPGDLAWLPGYDVLLIAEQPPGDGLAWAWTLDLRRMALKRVMVAAAGDQVRAVRWVHGLGQADWLAVGWADGGRKPTLLGPFPTLSP